MKLVVTGAAGFIGMHLCQRLLDRGDVVLGVDNLNPYYDPALKQARLGRLLPHPGFHFFRVDIADRAAIDDLFAREKPDRVVNLAAQAGVRYSLQNPHAYVDSNVVGFVNLLEACRHHGCAHFVYASSSSVYGGNDKLPFSEDDTVDHPVSLYAATKKANELMAHTYSHLYGLPATGLRFFTVYGPWGRPDMAYWLFADALRERRPINVFNHGRMARDFTYIDDIVEGVLRVLDRPPQGNPAYDRHQPDAATSWAPWRVFNIGNHQPVALLDFIAALEAAFGVVAEKNFLPLQPGDVATTFAAVERLRECIGFVPATPIETGVRRFAEWYQTWQERRP